jgi:NADPH:quinone reductase-like Zn-dependent oxidoreductase
MRGREDEGRMKAAVLEEIGKAPKCAEFDEPKASGAEEAVVRVRAAALKPVDQQLAGGTHFASPRESELPAVCGTDGVGQLEDGTRVFFGGCRKPFGAMAEFTAVPRAFCFPLPAGIEDDTAAALANPGVSAWISLEHRAKLSEGERVLVLGATGVTGQLAVQIAKLLGARRVIGVGRNERVLARLEELGADATIQLDQATGALKDAYASEMGNAGFDVILDYLWGVPAEGLLAVISKSEFAAATRETRWVQAGGSAGATIALPAAVLRSAPVTILGTAGIPSLEVLTAAMQQVMEKGAQGQLRIETERVPLQEIEGAWRHGASSGHRLVVIP